MLNTVTRSRTTFWDQAVYTKDTIINCHGSGRVGKAKLLTWNAIYISYNKLVIVNATAPLLD